MCYVCILLFGASGTSSPTFGCAFFGTPFSRHHLLMAVPFSGLCFLLPLRLRRVLEGISCPGLGSTLSAYPGLGFHLVSESGLGFSLVYAVLEEVSLH